MILFNNKYKVNFKFIIVALLIFVSEDTLLFGTNSNKKYIFLKYLTLISLFGIIIINKKLKIHKEKIFIYIALIICLISSLVFNNDITGGYFYRIFVLGLSILISEYINMEEFWMYFVRIMKVISISAIIGYGLKLINNYIFNMFPVITNVSGFRYSNLFITCIPENTEGFLRSYGIFREPGVYQMFLIVAMIIYMFVINEKKTFDLIIFTVALLLTFSTTGYIALIILLIGYFIKKQNLSEKKSRIKAKFMMILGLVFTYLMLFTDILYKEEYGSVFGKFSSNNGSLNARWASIITNIDMFFESPVFGKGITYVDLNYSYNAYKLLNIKVLDNTNTLFMQLAMFGLMFSIIWIILYYKFCLKITKNYYISLIILCVFFVLFMGQNLSYSMLFNLIPFYAIGKIKRKESFYKV